MKDDEKPKTEEEVKVAKPEQIPTLYLRNLNDKIKLEGKHSKSVFLSYELRLTFCSSNYRDASQSVYAFFNVWGDRASPYAPDLTAARLSFHSL